MIIHPELRALRGDDAPQRKAQARLFDAIDHWRDAALTADVLADLDAWGGGASLADCRALSALFTPGHDDAAALAGTFVAAMCDGLRKAPLGHVPARHFTDGVLSTLLLGRSGSGTATATATLSLVAVDGEGLRARPAPVSASFAPGESHEHVLAGTATALHVSCPFAARPGRVDMQRHATLLAPGTVTVLDCARQALLLDAVDGCLVSLRLQRRPARGGVAFERALADGALVHQAAGSARDSRVELMIALLGRMERADAAPLIATIAAEPGSAALRWQALRECLALDTATGFAALCAVAADPADELAGPAGALRAGLLERYPQLAGVARCPA